MEDQKQQLIQRLKDAKNVLVTVSKNPTVDQLSAAIGLAVALNRFDKHATAVFSGEIPSTLQFLRPEETLEKTTDSLRDFIIALDKSKADKLRYKVEDDVVRIFITPYHTAITESDLDFSQGEFNVDVVIALGVHEQNDLDDAVQAHGRILHDALFATLSLEQDSQIGLINIVDTSASSLSEMVLDIVENLGKKVLDVQIATALLTGIVATTERFSNDRTTPKTMSASAALMAAGANQQLITTELETAEIESDDPVEAYDKLAGVNEQGRDESTDAQNPTDLGTLEISHDTEIQNHPYDPDAYLPESDPNNPQIHVDENGKLVVVGQEDENTFSELNEPEMILPPSVSESELPKIELKKDRLAESPIYDNQTAADIADEGFGTTAEELGEQQAITPILSHNQNVLVADDTGELVSKDQSVETNQISENDKAIQYESLPNEPQPTIPIEQNIESPQVTTPKFDAPSWSQSNKTLTQIETEVNSPHLHANDYAMPSEIPVNQADEQPSAFTFGTPANLSQPAYMPANPPIAPEIPPQPPMSLPQPDFGPPAYDNLSENRSSQPAPPPVPPPIMPFN